MAAESVVIIINERLMEGEGEVGEEGGGRGRGSACPDLIYSYLIGLSFDEDVVGEAAEVSGASDAPRGCAGAR